MMFGMNQIMKTFLIKCGKYRNSFLTDDDSSLNVSRNFSNIFEENFPNHKRKHNVRLKLWHEVNDPKPELFWLITNNNCGMILNPVRVVKIKVRI